MPIIINTFWIVYTLRNIGLVIYLHGQIKVITYLSKNTCMLVWLSQIWSLFF